MLNFSEWSVSDFEVGHDEKSETYLTPLVNVLPPCPSSGSSTPGVGQGEMGCMIYTAYAVNDTADRFQSLVGRIKAMALR